MVSLRHVGLLRGYTLRTWDTGRRDERGQTYLRYLLGAPDGSTLFEGSDFAGSPLHPDDSDETLRSLLGFLTLKPGDTDAEYFDRYTPKQRAFSEGDAEWLSVHSYDDNPEPFVELGQYFEQSWVSTDGNTYECSSFHSGKKGKD